MQQIIVRESDEKMTSQVSQKIRLLGRVVEEGRKLTGDRNAMLENLVKPGNFDILISCALSIPGYEENDRSSSKKNFRAPATAVACGYELKRAAIVIC